VVSLFSFKMRTNTVNMYSLFIVLVSLSFVSCRNFGVLSLEEENFDRIMDASISSNCAVFLAVGETQFSFTDEELARIYSTAPSKEILVMKIGYTEVPEVLERYHLGPSTTFLYFAKGEKTPQKLVSDKVTLAYEFVLLKRTPELNQVKQLAAEYMKNQDANIIKQMDKVIKEIRFNNTKDYASLYLKNCKAVQKKGPRILEQRLMTLMQNMTKRHELLMKTGYVPMPRLSDDLKRITLEYLGHAWHEAHPHSKQEHHESENKEAEDKHEEKKENVKQG